MIKFVQYSTNVGYFVKNECTYSSYSYILNGKDASEYPVANGYTQLDQPLTSVKQLVKGKNTIIHYKLKDEELCCAKLPLTVESYIDDDDNIQGEGVEGYFSLYRPVYNQTEDEIQDVEFEIIDKGNSSYDGYTYMPELQGDNLQDLTEKLDIYLENLIAQLNSTVVECDCCKGTGHLITTFKH